MLVISLMLAALGAPPTVAAPANDSVLPTACEALAASVTTRARAADLAAALGLHGGVVRWAAGTEAVRVWIQRRPADGSSLAYGADAWRSAIVSAVASWNDLVPGLRLAVSRDSASADVRIVWTPSLGSIAGDDASAGALSSRATGTSAFGSYTAGRTLLVPDELGRAIVAQVVIATSSPGGASYSPSDVHAVAQHELGHALGLAHHRSSRSIMSPMIAVDHIGADDRAVLRALYALPVGASCAAPTGSR
jgi:predicted Zn-dependent protease